MALDPKSIEGRNYGVIPLTGGLNLTDAKALVQPGTLQDCMNYEVVDRGYTRGQGLMLYNGSYGQTVEDMWYLADTKANGATYSFLVPGDQQLGVEVEWDGGTGTLVYWDVNYDADPAEEYYAIGIVDIDGTPPTASPITVTQAGTAFFLTSNRAAQKLVDATYPNSGEKICGTEEDYLSFVNAATTAITSQVTDYDDRLMWNKYKPRPPGVGPITGGFQFNDTIYAARDFYGFGFYEGVVEPTLDTRLKCNGVAFRIAGIEVTSGYWEDGTAAGVIYAQPYNELILSGGVWSEATFNAIPDGTSIVNYSTGSVTYAKYLSANNKQKGQLWKGVKGEGWQHVDIGWQATYKDGTNAPNAAFAPLFTSSELGNVLDTGYKQTSTPVGTEVGTPPNYAEWTDLVNVSLDNASVASCTVGMNGGLSSLFEASVPLGNTGIDAKILGIEVQVKAASTVGTGGYINKLILVNKSTGAEQFIGVNKAEKQALTTSQAVYTFGGQLDKWGFDKIDPYDSYKVQVQFGNSDGSNNRTIEVERIDVKVHYITRAQLVYFHDPVTGSDSGFAWVHSWDVFDGIWGAPSNDASGTMTFESSTLYFINSTAPGHEIRTDTSGGGTLIATLTSPVTRNLLPSAADLAEHKSKWRTIEANFYANDESNAIYGCTGAGPAFIFDAYEKFAYIHPPIDSDKDKPRHVAFDANHLVLGMPSGHILISGIDQPNNFDPNDNASIFSFRDPVTGLSPLTGNALGVMCKASVSALLGTQQDATGANDPFRPQNITPLSGAREYTVADVMGPMYADFNGVTTADASDKFGDFGAGRLTEKVESWTRDRLQNKPATELYDRAPVFGIPVRSKNQYRLYFEDGYILTLYLGDPEQRAQCTIAHMDTANFSTDYVPTWMDSTVLSTGRERIVMGDKNGYVWVVDGANGIQDENGLTELDCWITTNPVNIAAPQSSHKTFSVQILGDFYGSQEITTSVGYDYLDVSSTPRTKVIGDATAPPFFQKRVDYTDVYVDALTDGTSFKIQTTMNGSKPHTLHTLLHRYSRKGTGRNNTQVPR